MKINFKTDNDAFMQDKAQEISRILEEINTKIKHGYESGNVYDINGNRVGEWSI